MKKSKPPTKSTRVKAVARKRLGSPKPGIILDDKREREKPKHKSRLPETDF